MRLLMILLVTSSLFGCASVQRPDSWICGVNAKAGKLRCYNLKEDYSDDGTIEPDAKPQEYPLASIKDLNAWTCMDPKSLEKLKVYMTDLRNYAREHCK